MQPPGQMYMRLFKMKKAGYKIAQIPQFQLSETYEQPAKGIHINDKNSLTLGTCRKYSLFSSYRGERVHGKL